MPPGDDPLETPTRGAMRWRIGGRAQGVGFRPFVYRLARRLGLSGWVRNDAGIVEIFAQGDARALAAFGRELVACAPPSAAPRVLESAPERCRELHDFAILDSLAHAADDRHVPPDLAPCDACLAELADPGERRYRYPFTNCTQCGPRYSLIMHLPYDRANTTMAGFELCSDCRAEYRHPAERRFHAQPLACPRCGPRLSFATAGGRSAGEDERALQAGIAALRQGLVIAVKGVGGYHLMCDARAEPAVARLRARKHRPDKPLALMFPDDGSLAALHACVRLEPEQERLLRSPARPILLLPRRRGAHLAASIAPGLEELGVFLPCSPLHHLLLADFGAPLVATSANLSGEPILTDNEEAERRLHGVADAFLHHDRPIRRPVDDTVYRGIAGHPRPLRPGRGMAPLELALPFKLPHPRLAVGGHIKNTIALAWGERVVLSQHVGDLEGPRAREQFRATAEDLQALYDRRAEELVCDAHPGYATRRWAMESGLPLIEVPHHRAHAAVLPGEYPDVQRWLVFTWDGTGYGEDGRLWGGEALLGRPGRWRRVGTFRRFRLPGGERAAREPWRSALALCWARGTDWEACPVDRSLLHEAWVRRINSPLSSSVGRLFDAAAALTGLTVAASFDGQAPMLLEGAAEPATWSRTLPLRATAGGFVTDWGPLVGMLKDTSLSAARRAGLFHDALARALVSQACAVRERYGDCVVGLCGGVFQNRRLSEHAADLLGQHGFDVRLPRRVPVNDAGLAYGQLIEAHARLQAGDQPFIIGYDA